MATVIRIFLLLGFVTLVPLLVFFITLKTTNVSTKTVKVSLRNAEVYETLHREAFAYLTEVQDSETAAAIKFVEPYLKKEITPDYLKDKVEDLIDDTDKWAKGKTKKEPVLSFADLKKKLTSGNTKMLTQLTTFAKEIDKELAAAAREQGGDMPSMGLEKMISEDMTYPLGKYLSWVKALYAVNRVGLGVVAGIMGVELLLIIVLSAGMAGKLRWVGLTGIFGALSLIIPILLVKGASAGLATGVVESSDVIASVVSQVLGTIAKPILAAYGRIGMYTAVGMGIGGAVMFAFSFASHPSPAPVAKSSTPKSSKKSGKK